MAILIEGQIVKVNALKPCQSLIGRLRSTKWGCWLAALLSLQILAVQISAVSKEFQLKAVLVWRLAQFVNWPANTFSEPGSPIVIGVLGENPFGDALELAVRGETAHGRTILVKYYRRVDEIRECNILFVSRSETSRAEEINQEMIGRKVLTVSDIEGFAQAKRGMIRFMSEQGKITLRINLDAVQSAGLVLDARLLRMAEVVRAK